MACKPTCPENCEPDCSSCCETKCCGIPTPKGPVSYDGCGSLQYNWCIPVCVDECPEVVEEP